MPNFNRKFEKILKRDSRFIDQDGDLLKNEVIDKAWKVDHKLVALLLEDKEVKSKFFTEIKGHWIFNVSFFVDFVQDKNFLNDSYTKFKNKIGLTIDGKYLNQRGEVALVWPYKDCILEGGMSDEEMKRDEIFFNEILAQDEIDRLLDPKVLTNFKRYTQDGEQKVTGFKRDENGQIKDNLIIKGNNLIALHCLKKQFAGKVKLIYIDPPYNTRNDSFKYNDRFNHSTWLTFMKNRLEVAKELLREDGVIFISCDDNEQAYLKVLMDDVFGRDNFINNIIWHKKRGKDNSAKYFSITHEFLVVYSKNKNSVEILRTELDESTKKAYKNPDKDPRGDYRVLGIWSRQQGGSEYEFTTKKGTFYSKRLWLVNQDTMKRLDNDNRLIESGDKLYYKKFLSENQGSIPETIWLDSSNNANAKDEIKKLFGEAVFTTPKPEPYLQKILNIATSKNDIVLDFHLGSGTTASVAHKMGRQYIGIEQMDYIETVIVDRLNKIIEGEQGGISKSVNWQEGGEFIYFELKTYNQDFIDRIQVAKDTKTLQKIWGGMKEKSFLNWNVDFRQADLAFEEWKKLDLNKQQHALIQLLNKNQLYINYSEIEDENFKCSEEEKKISKQFYNF